MANGVQLATAYISLNVRTDDIKKQVSSALSGVGSDSRRIGTSIGSKISDGIRSSFSGSSLTMSLFNPMEIAGVRWAMKAGVAIGSALKKAMIGAASLTGVGSIFAVGGVLSAGLDRLKTIQRAEVQLSLKLPPDQISAVRKQIEEVVRGTPIPLDEALQAVPRALSAGIKPGKELQQYIKDIADTAASTGGQAGFGQIDIIFSQILGKGKLMGEELMQLTENGVDLRNALKNTFNWDDKKLNSFVAKGKVGMKEIQQAVEATWGKDGGLSKKMGTTFDGAVGNLKASVARLGANILGVIFGDPNNPDDPLSGAIDGITSLTQKLDTAGKWVAAHREDIRGYFNGAKDTAVKFGGKVKEIINFFRELKNTATEVTDWFSTKWDQAGDAVTRVRDRVSTAMDNVKTKVTDVIDSLKAKWDGIFGPQGWFAEQFDKLGSLVDKVRDVLGLGEATANAAAPSTTPFNPGPRAPGRTGSREPGWGGPTAMPGGFSKSAVFGQVPAGRYVTADEFATGNVETLGDLTLGLGDCTSAIQDLVNLIEGKPTEGRALSNGDSFWTGNAEQWAAENGFVATDRPMPGTFQVGFSDTHAQATLPSGDAFNWGSNDSAAMSGLDGGQGAWFDGANKHYYKRYGSGGGIRGAGTGTSDSIPAWLSNGEHVLTAKDVQAMGGQNNVYAFRNALHRANGGAIPGFAPGGAVDPNTIQDAQDNIADLNNAYEVAAQRYSEAMQNGEATPGQILGLAQQMGQAKRALDNAAADLPAIMSGQTPQDRSEQNNIYSLTDQLAMAQQQAADLQASGEAPMSQITASNYQLEQLKRERNQAIARAQSTGTGTDYGQEFVRSLGFVPASAGNTGVAGTSSLAGFIGMGNDVVGGLIDTGTNLAQTAVSAAITAGAAAGSFGAGAAAAPAASAAASYGIQLLGNQAKRISSYGFQLAGIGADALMEQISPFGMPRALGYDYGSFAPQLGIQEAATSTIEKMGTDAINKQFAGGKQGLNIPAEPTAPAASQETNLTPSGPSAETAPAWLGGAGDFPRPLTSLETIDKNIGQNPVITNPLDPRFGGGGGGGNGGGGSWARGGAVGIYDNGGVLEPGQLAFNASRTPEGILTKQQWDAMMSTAATKPKESGPLVQNLYAQDMQDAIRQLEKVKRRDMMQYAGRS